MQDKEELKLIRIAWSSGIQIESSGGDLETSSTATGRGSGIEDRLVQRESKTERSWHLTKSARELRMRRASKLHKTLSTE